MNKIDETPALQYWVKSCYIPTKKEVWVAYNYNDLFYTENRKEAVKSMNKTDKFIMSMASHFSSEFAEYASSHEKLHEVMMEVAEEFVCENAPVLDDETTIDLAAELLIATTIRPV